MIREGVSHLQAVWLISILRFEKAWWLEKKGITSSWQAVHPFGCIHLNSGSKGLFRQSLEWAAWPSTRTEHFSIKAWSPLLADIFIAWSERREHKKSFLYCWSTSWAVCISARYCQFPLSIGWLACERVLLSNKGYICSAFPSRDACCPLAASSLSSALSIDVYTLFWAVVH